MVYLCWSGRPYLHQQNEAPVKPNMNKFTEEVLEASNAYRKRHGAVALKLNKEISKVSQAWAEHLAKTDTMSHNPSPIYKNTNMGENIAMRYSSDMSEYSGYQAVDQWYLEISNYSFKTHSGPKTGHFTQLVWKGSLEMGLGRAQTKEGKWLVVANYFPAGNFVGEYAMNVLPPTDGKISSMFSHAYKSDPVAMGGNKVKREIQEATKGTGADAVMTRTTIETITTPDGKTTVNKKVETFKGESAIWLHCAIYMLITITESWLRPDHPDGLIAIDGYTPFRKDRPGRRRGGGVVIYLKSSISSQIHIVPPHAVNDTLETLCLKCIIDSEPYIICAIYHLSNEVSTMMCYINELSNTALGSDSKLIIGVDFNQLDHYSILQTGLHPIFWGPTHQGHNLDRIYGINVNLDITFTYRPHVSTHHLGVVAAPPPPPTNSTSRNNTTRQFISFRRVSPAFNISTTSTSIIYSTSTSPTPTILR
ncbi:hypothetical protein HELRODRAFT_171767 [Helobdella robusta]|uniref:SCP domain-containing protein n=1 Tax=Helobdella robusta TaxID=6412 RepID=T1F4M7_HELRO|nr:hypothetical protein HELRODRAFT_171767 [Helobdella robusta]ESO05375.1 hypothetical protein HELRODRAFT_171767 [Helobdella robusta]